MKVSSKIFPSGSIQPSQSSQIRSVERASILHPSVWLAAGMSDCCMMDNDGMSFCLALAIVKSFHCHHQTWAYEWRGLMNEGAECQKQKHPCHWAVFQIAPCSLYIVLLLTRAHCGIVVVNTRGTRGNIMGRDRTLWWMELVLPQWQCSVMNVLLPSGWWNKYLDLCLTSHTPDTSFMLGWHPHPCGNPNYWHGGWR
jgi:hypothetical protein